MGSGWTSPELMDTSVKDISLYLGKGSGPGPLAARIPSPRKSVGKTV